MLNAQSPVRMVSVPASAFERFALHLRLPRFFLKNRQLSHGKGESCQDLERKIRFANHMILNLCDGVRPVVCFLRFSMFRVQCKFAHEFVNLRLAVRGGGPGSKRWFRAAGAGSECLWTSSFQSTHAAGSRAFDHQQRASQTLDVSFTGCGGVVCSEFSVANLPRKCSSRNLVPKRGHELH